MKAFSINEQLLDVKQMARLLGISESWLRERIKDGRIPHYRVGGRIRVYLEDVEAWRRAQAIPSPLVFERPKPMPEPPMATKPSRRSTGGAS